MIKIRMLMLLALMLRPVLSSPAAADDSLASFPPARIIRTHNSQGAVVFWDATAYIERFATLGTSKKDAIRMLKFKAFKIFESETPHLPSADRHLTVVAAFAKTGALSARYQTKSFEGVQNLLVLDGNVRNHMKFPPNADNLAQRGVFPRGIKLQLASHIFEAAE